MRVTFDSNVWEKVVRLEKCESSERREQANLIRKALADGRMTGFFCEAWATLLAVKKKDRADFLAKQAIEPRIVHTILPDGTPSTACFAGPNQSHRPPLPPEFRELLTEAADLGLRVLIVPRSSELDLPGSVYAPQTELIANQTFMRHRRTRRGQSAN